MYEQWGEQQRSLCRGNTGWLLWGEPGRPGLCWPQCGSMGQRQEAAMPAWLLSLRPGTHLGVKERNV